MSRTQHQQKQIENAVSAFRRGRWLTIVNIVIGGILALSGSSIVINVLTHALGK